MKQRKPTPLAQRAVWHQELRHCIFCCSAVLFATGLLWTPSAPEMLKFRLTAASGLFVVLTFTAVSMRALRK
jgi:hypothetical protein